MRLFRSLAFVWAIAVTALMSAVALIFPATDLVVSAYFYVPGRGFPASNETAMLALRSAGRILPGLAIAGVVLLGKLSSTVTSCPCASSVGTMIEPR